MSARILGDTLSLIIDQGEDGLAHLTWFGPQADEEMAAAPAFQRLPASPDIAVGPTLLPEHGRGFHGISQVEGQCTATQLYTEHHKTRKRLETTGLERDR